MFWLLGRRLVFLSLASTVPQVVAVDCPENSVVLGEFTWGKSWRYTTKQKLPDGDGLRLACSDLWRQSGEDRITYYGSVSLECKQGEVNIVSQSCQASSCMATKEDHAWRDSDGDGCSAYERNGWCARDWVEDRSSPLDGLHARQKCCACGKCRADQEIDVTAAGTGMAASLMWQSEILNGHSAYAPCSQVFPGSIGRIVLKCHNGTVKLDPASRRSCSKKSCVDKVGWRDAEGDECAKYEAGDFCTRVWVPKLANRTTGLDARQACCACGGGDLCYDTLGWKDKEGDTCDEYEAGSWCSRVWVPKRKDPLSGLDARAACCSCGGGHIGAAAEAVASNASSDSEALNMSVGPGPRIPTGPLSPPEEDEDEEERSSTELPLKPGMLGLAAMAVVLLTMACGCAIGRTCRRKEKGLAAGKPEGTASKNASLPWPLILGRKRDPALMDHPGASGVDPEADPPLRWAQAAPRSTTMHLSHDGNGSFRIPTIQGMSEVIARKDEPLEILDLALDVDLPGTPADTRPGTAQSVKSLY
jgi:hypothetical protein